jgi:hypothetical protein
MPHPGWRLECFKKVCSSFIEHNSIFWYGEIFSQAHGFHSHIEPGLHEPWLEVRLQRSQKQTWRPGTLSVTPTLPSKFLPESGAGCVQCHIYEEIRRLHCYSIMLSL